MTSYIRLIILLCVLFTVDMQAYSPMPEEAPKVKVDEAIEIATKHVSEYVKTEKFFIQRIWLLPAEEQTPRRWVVTWSPLPENQGDHNGWIIVNIDMNKNIIRSPFLDKANLK